MFDTLHQQAFVVWTEEQSLAQDTNVRLEFNAIYLLLCASTQVAILFFHLGEFNPALGGIWLNHVD